MNVKKGFTLVEILLGVFILEIGLLGISTFYAYSFKINKVARQETTAANLAAGLVDEQLSDNFDNITVSEGLKVPYTADTTNPLSAYQKKVDISYIDQNLSASYVQSNENKDMKKILVTIYWMDGPDEKSFETATIKAKH